IVPFSRGTSRSVEPRRVMAALDEVHARGFKEAVLTGVHLGGYGKDLDPPVELANLLEMIAERCPIGRVRISSLDPEELSDRIIEILAQSRKFCPHLHLPLQSGDDGILKRMRRRYDANFYRGRVERILAAMPDAAIGTDIIAGFPGETRRDFEVSFNFAESLPLAYFHVFPYSVRTGTTAAKLSGKVESAEIKRRAEAMRRLGECKRREFAARQAGGKLQVLLEGVTEAGRLSGYSRNYVRVAAPGGAELANREAWVEALAVEGTQLVGRIIRPDAEDAAGAGAA
ncbi:MAG: radical SAM protein, partial [Candidatus Binataceae bacterium]